MTRIKKPAKVFLVVIMAFFSFLVFWRETEAIGISIKPAEIKIKTILSKPTFGRIIVKNPSPAALLFDIYPDEYEKNIKAMPSSFVLEGGNEREAVIRADMDGAGLFTTMLSVTAQPLSSREIEAAAGVKVPIHIEVEKEKNFAALLEVFGQNGLRNLFFLVLGALLTAAIRLAP